jgi:hypothetical protein
MEEPIDIKFDIPEPTLQSLFGIYTSDETADEIIFAIRVSKVFNRNSETL